MTINRSTIPFEVAISTNQKSINTLIERLSDNHSDLHFLIIWQTTTKKALYINNNPKNIKIIISNTSGLSTSRNIALRSSLADYLLISDDDIEYLDDIENKIMSSIAKHELSPIFTFQIKTPDNTPYKSYPNGVFNHNWRTILSVSSVEIVLNRKLLLKHNLQFDEQFGLGSSYPMGEEPILLSDTLKKGSNLIGFPIFIVSHPKNSSSNSFNECYMKARGALFQRIYSFYAAPLLILFILKNIKSISHENNVFRSILQGLSGINEYLEKNK